MLTRRAWIGAMAALLAWLPCRVWAAWNAVAFESPRLADALQGLGVARAEPSPDVILVAPDMAENGAIVQIEVESRIPGTEAIAVLVEKNPTPLVANFMFSHGAEPYVVTRIKMAETSGVQAIVKVGGRYYSVSKRVEVAVGGCN